MDVNGQLHTLVGLPSDTKPSYARNEGLVGSHHRSGCFGENQYISCLCLESNHDSSIMQSNHYTDRAVLDIFNFMSYPTYYILCDTEG